jgi:hypothetical protein
MTTMGARLLPGKVVVSFKPGTTNAAIGLV